MVDKRKKFEVTSKDQVGFGRGFDYGGERLVRGEDMNTLVQAFLPVGLEGLSLPSGENVKDRNANFFEDPIRHLFVISSIVRQRLRYTRSGELPPELNGGAAGAGAIWRSGQGNCQAFSIVFASILKHFGVASRMMSLASPARRPDGTRAHPPHMVLMILFPEEGFPSTEDNRHSDRCAWLWNHGLDELLTYAHKVGYSGKDYIGDRPFRRKGGTEVERKLKWTHVSIHAKAHVRMNAAPGHYLLHSPLQMVGQYYGLIKSVFLDSGDRFHFSLQAKVRWSNARTATEDEEEVHGNDAEDALSVASESCYSDSVLSEEEEGERTASSSACVSERVRKAFATCDGLFCSTIPAVWPAG